MFDNYKEMANKFREVADAIEKVGSIDERTKSGEIVPEEEMEAAMGKLMLRMLELESLKDA